MNLFWILIQTTQFLRQLGKKCEHELTIRLGRTVVSKKISYLLGMHTVVFTGEIINVWDLL